MTAGVAAAQSARSAPASDQADAFSDAARKGDVAAVRKLLDEGLDVNTKFRYGRNALAFACDRGHVEVVKLLLERGADVNNEDTFYHATPLTWALNPAMGRTPQHAEIVALLLKHNPKGKDAALMAAVSAGDVALTKVVLDSGAMSPDALTNGLEAAARGNKKDIAALLEQAGAKPRVEFKIDAADLAKYAGTYSSQTGVDFIVSVVDGRLTGAAAGQKLTFLPRDPTTFGVAEIPGFTATFKIEGGNVIALTLGQGGAGQIFTRAPGK